MKFISMGAIALAMILTTTFHAQAEEVTTRVELSESYKQNLVESMARYLRLAKDKPCLQEIKQQGWHLEFLGTMHVVNFRKLHQLSVLDAQDRQVGSLEIVTDKGAKKFTVIEACRFKPAAD